VNELSAMFISAQRNLSALNLPVRLFSGAQQVSHAPFAACADTPVMEGLTPRMQRLRNHYLTVRPSVSIYRALAFTEVVKANPGMPTILLRAKAFRHACETAPILIQDDELIVGHPCGKPRAGAFSPDIAWRWVRDELDTMSTRPQDPFEISEADKKPFAKRSSRSGKAVRWMRFAKRNTVRLASGPSAARPSSATSPITRLTAAAIPARATTCCCSPKG
jgi:formate C-acetyltransferase